MNKLTIALAGVLLTLALSTVPLRAQVKKSCCGDTSCCGKSCCRNK